MPRFGGMGGAFGRMGGGGKVAATAAAAAFSPLDLTPALWIDPSDTTVMFQSNAGTTTVTDGSVCGYAGDKSGNSKNLTSTADDTTRPLWQNNAGLPYLGFDGVNDLLRLASSLGIYASASGYSIFLAMRGNPITTSECVISEASSSSNNPINNPVKCGNVTASSHCVFQRNDAGSTPVNANNTVVQTSVFDNTFRVIGITDSTTAMIPYNNGTAGSTNSYTRAADPITFDRFGLGALLRAAAGSWARADIAGLVIVTRVITAGERASLVTYLGAKVGLTL